ncbi:MAG: hypothetical protein J5988_08455 [Eubacterium sp.]|nr:hypothetical protein [Eubacterium sp.]
MEDIVLLLYLREEEYGRRLLRFLLSKKNPWLHPELVTEKQHLVRRVSLREERLAVLTDDRTVQADEKVEIIYLSNEQDREQKKIFQYQTAEGIYGELLAQLELKQEGTEKTGTLKKSEGIFSVFSPGGRGTTCISVYLSQYLGCQGKCLYLSVTGFPLYYSGEFQGQPQFTKKGLSELLFSLSGKRFSERVEEVAENFGKAWMLPPPRHYKDILDCTPEEWELFLTRLRKECGYDSIVVELGQLMEHTFDYLELSDRIFLLEEGGKKGRLQSAIYENYCQMEKKAGGSKVKKIMLPLEFPQWEERLMEQSVEEITENGQVMSMVEGWIEDGAGNIPDFTAEDTERCTGGNSRRY